MQTLRNIIDRLLRGWSPRAASAGVTVRAGEDGGDGARTPRARGVAVAPVARFISRSLEPLGIELLEGRIRRSIELIPPIPEVVLSILRELNSDTSSARSIATMIARDASLTAALLRLANSAAFSPAQPISSVAHAVSFVGYSAVRAQILRLRLDKLVGPAMSSPEAEELWTHALVVSHVAEVMARRFKVDRGYCSTVGLLHDLGKLVILRTRSDEAAALSIPGPGDESRLGRERRILGADHAAIGAHVAARWGLPSTIVEAIRYHHAPQMLSRPAESANAADTDSGEPGAAALARTTAVVFVANQLAKYLHAYSDDTEIDLPSGEVRALLSIPADPGDLIDDAVRKAVSDGLLLAAASLGRAPGATGRLIRLTSPERRRLALDNALLLGSDDSGVWGESASSATAMLFSAAAGESESFHSRSTTEDATTHGAVVKALAGFRAAEHPRLRIALTIRWLSESLRSLDSAADISVVVSKRDGQIVACVRSEAMRFDKRFGEHVNPELATRVVRSECAGLINLRWFSELRCSSEGGALLMVA